MPREPRTLSALVSFHVGGAMLLLLVLLLLALSQITDRFFAGALREKADALAAQLATVTLDAVLVSDYGTIERYVRDLVDRRDALFIEIERNDGEVLGRAGARVDGQPLVSQPLRLAAERLGEIRVQYDTRRLAGLTWQITIAAVLAVALLSGTLFVVLRRLLQNSIVEPVQRLAQQLTPVGNPAEFAPPANSPREVVDLAGTFNALQARIREHIEEIERAHQVENEAIRRLCGEQRLATLGQMAAELAHEMNTPISNILGYAQTSIARVTDEEVRRRLAVISDHARRLQRSVSDMLSSVRAPQPRRAVLDLRELVESIARLTTPILRRHDARMEVSSDSRDVRVLADASMTEQILFNLQSNAIQAGARMLVVRFEPAETSACLEMTDDGSGIPAKIRERIFEPFVTGHADGTGTGLGLAISQRLAREMDGTLTLLESRPGRTVFRLCLPVASDPAAATP